VKCSDDPTPTVVQKPRRIFEANRGLPNYRIDTPFRTAGPGFEAALQDAVAGVTASDKTCEVGKVSGADSATITLSSNVCDRERFGYVRMILKRMAPFFKQENLTFSKVRLAPDREGLLVSHVDISTDEPFRYPYLSLWFIDARGASNAT